MALEAALAQGSTLKILIADDHEMICESLAKVLGQESDMHVTTTQSLEGVSKLIDETGTFDIILLDIDMTGMMGIPSVEMLVQRNAGGAIVVFSGSVNDEFVWGAINAGARGYISKSSALKPLASTIRLIHAGQIFVPINLTRESAQHAQGNDSKLTPRERAILESVSNGKTNKEIAREIDSTEVTIKMVMRTICSKLGAKNRTHAAMMFRQSAPMSRIS